MTTRARGRSGLKIVARDRAWGVESPRAPWNDERGATAAALFLPQVADAGGLCIRDRGTAIAGYFRFTRTYSGIRL